MITDTPPAQMGFGPVIWMAIKYNNNFMYQSNESQNKSSGYMLIIHIAMVVSQQEYFMTTL